MIIGIDYLLTRVRNNELITNLSERELTQPEGAGFDLRAGELYKLKGGGYLGRIERQTSASELVASYQSDTVREYELKPNNHYLVKTIEEFNLDENMFAFFHPRSTLFRSGVVFQSSTLTAGYEGALVFSLSVIGEYNFKLEMGSRIAHVNFMWIDGRANEYGGQWGENRGRVSTRGKEKQI